HVVAMAAQRKRREAAGVLTPCGSTPQNEALAHDLDYWPDDGAPGLAGHGGPPNDDDDSDERGDDDEKELIVPTRTCPACKGSGRSNGAKCARCGGSGRLRIDRDDNDDDVDDNDEEEN